MSVINKLEYEVQPGWEQLPAGFVHRDVSDVAVDSHDRVYLATRSDARVFVYEQDGTFVTEWGNEIFSSGVHGIEVAPDDTVWVVDQFNHVARKFTPDGKELMSLGNPGVASDTGFDMEQVKGHYERLEAMKYGGEPFNNPTNLTVAPNGDIYVTDGYYNARVHRFSADGTLIRSWGGPGDGPSKFRVPHDAAVDGQGRILVCDRENDHIQLFTADGDYIETWQSQKPCGIEVHNGLVYVSETRLDPGTRSFTRGQITELEWARVSIYNEQGEALARFGWGENWPEDAPKPGVITSAHGIAVDSRGDIYVAETTYSSVGRKGLVPEDCHTFQKFVLKG